jgi:hypothetical protein
MGGRIRAFTHPRAHRIARSACQRCGKSLRIIASIEQPAVIAKILSHLERAAPQLPPPQRPPGVRAPAVQSRRL